MSFPPYRINADPDYWRALSFEDFQVACLLYTKDIRKATLLHCHYMLEKILKAILAQQKRLDDTDADHKLVPLSDKAFGNKLPEHERSFLFDVTRWHVGASYPDDQFIYDIPEDDNLFKSDFEKCSQLYLKFRTWYEEHNEHRGESDE